MFSLEKDQNYFNASFNLADAVYKQERYKEASALFDALKDDAPTDEDLTDVEFQETVGDILMNIIDESLEHDQIEFRTDNSI